MWGGLARLARRGRPAPEDGPAARPEPGDPIGPRLPTPDELRKLALEREMAFLRDYARRLEDGEVGEEERIFRAARLEPGWTPPALPEGTRLVRKATRERFVGTGLTREQSFLLEANCLIRLNRAEDGRERRHFPLLAEADPEGMTLATVWAGRSLDALGRGGERVAVPDLAGQVEAMVAGLERARVVHLDLHASGKNLIVDEDGHLTLIDYGNAVLDRAPWSARMRDKLEQFDAEGGYAGTARRLAKMVKLCPGVRLLVLLLLDGAALALLEGAWPGLGGLGWPGPLPEAAGPAGA